MGNLSPDITQLFGGQPPAGWQSVGQAINEPSDLQKLAILLSMPGFGQGQASAERPMVPPGTTSAPQTGIAYEDKSKPPIAPTGDSQGASPTDALSAFLSNPDSLSPSSRQTVATPSDAVGDSPSKGKSGFLNKKGIGGGTIGQNILVGLLTGLAAATKQPEHIAASYQAGIDLGRKRKEEDEQSKRIAEMFPFQKEAARLGNIQTGEQTKGITADTAMRSFDLEAHQKMLPGELRAQLDAHNINQAEYDFTVATQNDKIQGSRLNLQKLVFDIDKMPAEYAVKFLAATQNNEMAKKQIEGLGIENGLNKLKWQIQSRPDVMAATIKQIKETPTGKEDQAFRVKTAETDFKNAKDMQGIRNTFENGQRINSQTFQSMMANKNFTNDMFREVVRYQFMQGKVSVAQAQAKMKLIEKDVFNPDLFKHGIVKPNKQYENNKPGFDKAMMYYEGYKQTILSGGAAIDPRSVVESVGVKMPNTDRYAPSGDTNAFTAGSAGFNQDVEIGKELPNMAEFAGTGVIYGKQMSWDDYENNVLRPSGFNDAGISKLKTAYDTEKLKENVPMESQGWNFDKSYNPNPLGG